LERAKGIEPSTYSLGSSVTARNVNAFVVKQQATNSKSANGLSADCKTARARTRPLVGLAARTIRAELSGDDRYAVAGITATSVLSLCQKLIADGHDPASPIEAYRGEVLCLRIRSAGEVAGLAVEVGRDGPSGALRAAGRPRAF
jgi:hypothetical protein